MKKLLCLVLVISMLGSMFSVTMASAQEFDNNSSISQLLMNETEANREEQLAERELDYVELNLFQDIFATYAERQSDDWWAWKEGEISSIWPYKGIGSGIEPKYPFSRSNVTGEYAMMIDLEGATKYTDAIDLKTNPKVAYDETLGRYIVSAKNTKYKLGEIAEGKKGGNFATFGVKYDTTTNAVADGIGIKEQNLDSDIYPNIGTSTQIQKAVYPINKTGVKEISFLMTSTVVSSKAKNTAVYVPATITYTDGLNTTKEDIGFVVGSIGASMQDSIYAVPASAGYTTVADIKANAVKGSEAAGKDIVNSNIIIPQLSTRTTYIPNESFILATLMRSYVGGEFAGYVHSFTIPVDSTRTIVSIEFKKDTALSTNYFAPDAGAIADGTSGSSTCLIPVEIEGVEDNNIYYLQSTRNCGAAGIFAMTLGGSSLNDEIKALEERMATATTGKEAQEIDADLEELISSTIVEKSDFDAEILAAYEAKKDYFAQQAIEEERQEKLKEKTYTYLDYKKDRDVFVSYEDLVNYGRFNTAAVSSGSSTLRVNEKYTYAEGIELFRYLPHITSDGTPVTGQEDYYFRGFQNSDNTNLPPVGERGYVQTSANAYLSDSFFVEDGSTVTGLRVNALATNTSKEYYEGTIERKEGSRKITAPTFVQKIDENGFAIIKNGDVQTKIGPVSKTEIKGNSARLATTGVVLSDISKKGARLDLVITSNGVNTAGGYTTKATASDPTKPYLATQAVPTAGLQEVVINYKDGTYENKKVIVVHNANAGANDTAYRSIVFAPKYDSEGKEITYNERSFYLDSKNHSFTMLSKSNVSTIGLTIDKINKDTIKFASENIVYSTTGILATMVNNRQDVANSDYGAYTSIASIPLQNKEVESVNMPYNISAALDEPSAIVVSNNESSTAAPSITLLPIEIEGASENYVYFVYCGRVAGESYLMGATVMDISAKEKIEKAEKAMAEIKETSSLDEAKKAKELYEIALAEALVDPAKDFDAEIVENFFETYEKVREATKLYADVDLKFYVGEAPKAKVRIHNAAELADKPYTVIMAYYDEKGVMVGRDIKSGVTTTEETVDLVFENAEYPATTKTVKVLLWKDLASLIPLGEAVVAQATDKKVYMFVGDSITHSDEYRTHTEAYYMTRFPGKNAEFVNAGRSGGTANSALRRVEWDMLPNGATHAVIMFGMNDVDRTGNYTPGKNTSDDAKQLSVDTCLGNIETLAGMLEEEGIDITLMTPSIYDEREYETASENLVGVNGALTKVADGMKKLAAAKEYSVIDTNTVMNAINEKLWNTGALEMNIKDRVHPGTRGTYVIAYNVIKGLFPNSGLVASVEIDANSGSSNAENATVENVEATKEYVSYTYTAKALPWAATTSYLDVEAREYLDLTEELNREIIKVTGLEAGSYNVKIDNAVVGIFTAEELAEGVNIAILEKNPGQVQSKEVYALLNQKHIIARQLRDTALVEDVFRARNIFGNAEAIAKYIADEKAKGNNMSIYENFDTDKLQEPAKREEMENYTKQARVKSIPVAHTVEITK